MPMRPSSETSHRGSVTTAPGGDPGVWSGAVGVSGWGWAAPGMGHTNARSSARATVMYSIFMLTSTAAPCYGRVPIVKFASCTVWLCLLLRVHDEPDQNGQHEYGTNQARCRADAKEETEREDAVMVRHHQAPEACDCREQT